MVNLSPEHSDSATPHPLEEAGFTDGAPVTTQENGHFFKGRLRILVDKPFFEIQPRIDAFSKQPLGTSRLVGLHEIIGNDPAVRLFK